MPELLHHVQILLLIFVKCCKKTDLTVVTDRTILALMSVPSPSRHVPQWCYARQETVAAPLTGVHNWPKKCVPQQAMVSDRRM
jgi:hypothetical protein